VAKPEHKIAVFKEGLHHNVIIKSKRLILIGSRRKVSWIANLLPNQGSSDE
jgi:hypothetical protein